MAAITGLVSRIRVGPIGPSPSGATRLPRSVPTALRSAPAQKFPPAPVSTATAASSSASKSRKASARAAAVGPSTALRASGRSMVTVVTGPSRSTSTFIAHLTSSPRSSRRARTIGHGEVTCLTDRLNNLYVKYMPTDQLSKVFSALADPTRREILTRLGDGDATVTELAEPFPISLPAVSRHLKVLEGAGLIARGPAGAVAHEQPARRAAQGGDDLDGAPEPPLGRALRPARRPPRRSCRPSSTTDEPTDPDTGDSDD